MKLGLGLHLDRGADAVIEEAKLADEQGFDSVWAYDHMMWFRPGTPGPEQPFECFTIMTAIGAVTKRTRLAWGMLNPSFRPPAVLAKMLATLDVITHGRVICTLGAGWFKEEYAAYDLPWLEDHDERIDFEREVVRVFKELWTRPAPDKVSFEGKYVTVRDLPFNPAPVQKPHIPIWIGGDSEATLGLVKELADGWVMLRSGNRETLAEVRSAPDWPKRPLTLAGTGRVFVATSHEAAVAEATRAFEATPPGTPGVAPALEEFLARAIVGSPDECIERLAEMESWGLNYVRLTFDTAEQQEQVATLLLPKLSMTVDLTGNPA